MPKPLLPLGAAALLLLLAACSGTAPRDDSDAASDEGPVIYGQLGVSVDYVEVE
jgi:hypothetical protein